MHDANGNWVGWGPGDSDPKVSDIKAYLRRMYKSYAGELDSSPVYDDALVAVVEEAQKRLGLPVTGIFNYATQVATGYVKAAPAIKPLFFTVEGHSSDMFHGPVADTATQLESEGRCHHQPIGYNDNTIPFDNNSGVQELARLVRATTMDNGVPFPAGTPWMLGTFSQGSIVGFDFFNQFMQPNQELNWRLKDFRGYLSYGDPCRATNSVAPWAAGWVTKQGTHGLDPYKRWDLPGCAPRPEPFADVYREGDIFAENADDKASEIKAAVYQAVARGDVFSNPYSLAAEIMDMFGFAGGVTGIVGGLTGRGDTLVNGVGLLGEIVGIIQAMISGIVFLSDQPNPHYSPYDISGGINWARGLLA